MPEQIMTLGRQTKELVLRGKNTTLTADFREIPFQCQFVSDAVNGAPLIRVSVQQVGKSQPEQIRVELIPPNRPGFNLSGQPLVIRATSPGNLTFRPTQPLAPTSNQPTVVFNVNTGFNPNRFGFGDAGDLFTDPIPPDLIDPFPDPIPPGGGGGAPSRKVFTHPLTPGVDPQGRWAMRLHNMGPDPAEFRVDVEYPETVQALETTRVPFQLLNRAFAEVLLLMSLRLRIDNGQASIRFDPEFSKLTGITNQTFSVSDRLQDINLESFKICAEQDVEFGEPVVRIGIELEERGNEIALPFLPDLDIDDLSIQVVFYLNLVAPPLGDFFATALVRRNGENIPRPLGVLAKVYTHPDLIGIWAHSLAWLRDIFGGQSFADEIEGARSKLESALNKLTRDAIGAYIQETLVHLVEKDHALHTVRCDKNALIVEHHALPFASSGLTPGDFVGAIDDSVIAASPPDLIGRGPTVVETTLTTSRLAPTFTPSLTEPRGQPAPVPAAARRRLREGEIDHIVFLMMENRSFDHMLGYLSLKGRSVEGLTGQERNSLPEGNPAYVVHHLTQTRGIPSPRHGFNDAKKQIADGQMTGFVANYATRKSVKDPSLAMSYYTETELPVYEFFANNFAVCDAWHSSHPGATQPNRFCAMTGQAPEKDNFDLTDDRLGYLKETSIFDFLTAFGVDWAYAEGNVAFIRMFDRYRLDTQHVIPYQDDFNQGIKDTFVSRVQKGNLPAVTYIDPRFIDIPPLWDANDDLPPADVCYGQALVKEVYSLLSSAATWPRTLLVVTYDEHGGFFDHVPPPGTPAADNPSPLPRVTPDGADHLGVRVPAFLVSPWVDAGSVITTQLEHTSIIKTILERFVSVDHANRGVLGARAAQANSLLPLLRSRPRTDIPIAPEVVCAPNIRGGRSPAARDDFHTSMRFMGLPADRRRRLVG
jgi:phospholipase C